MITWINPSYHWSLMQKWGWWERNVGVVKHFRCIGDCTPTRDRGQSEVKRSRRRLSWSSGQARNRGQLKYGQSLSRRSMGVVNAR